jgi:hypothetical protein
MSRPSLETLRAALYQVGAQAEAIKATETEKDGSTWAIADEVSREVEYLSEQVSNEMRALKAWGVEP